MEMGSRLNSKTFSAAKAALEMQMSVCLSVRLSVRLSVNISFKHLKNTFRRSIIIIKPIGKVPMGKLDTPRPS